MSIFVDGNKEVGNRWGGRHAHGDAFVLEGVEVPKAHAIVGHDDVECVKKRGWRKVGEA